MSRLLTRLSILTLAGAAACGGDGGGIGGPSGGATLTTLVISPTTGTLPNTPPGNTQAISVTAKDQYGNTMTNAGSPLFSSSNTGIATVNANGGRYVGSARQCDHHGFAHSRQCDPHGNDGGER